MEAARRRHRGSWIDRKGRRRGGRQPGVGRGIAEVLAQEGANVLLSGRVPEVVKAAVEGIRSTGGTVAGIVADMTVKSGAVRIVDAARQEFGEPDILVVEIHRGGARPGYQSMAWF